MDHQDDNRNAENELDPLAVKRHIRLVIARLRERLTTARNHGLIESMRGDSPFSSRDQHPSPGQ
ncbi:hypothetical protein FHS29_000143 [Saccharothrix tamanrassetensis]|uniref:Uncharacterized protein n=1 Tax=Saccharothrix tamanrassetensis TaxID=1051531 RepID=A0A841C9F7_9PSEU|nr:hypothetical protein [Saccharothrix tamanrassetensis]MBB5953573.1 hypothetical protein [Saccharothrix tamanrassetensis]